MTTTDPATANDLPLTCSLTAGERATRRETITGLFAAAQAARELEDGYAFQFPGTANLLWELVEWIAAERACCPFFSFVLTFTPSEGPVWFEVRGPEGVKEFLRGSAVAGRAEELGAVVS
jgi:hypothetical protein